MGMLRTLPLLLALLGTGAYASNVVVIGHPSLARVDSTTVQKIFTGRISELDGLPVTAINSSAGSSIRARFLHIFLSQDEDKYIAYWTVRRYIGKGVPPREFATSADIISFVQNTPGAIGYIDEADLKPGLNVLLRK